MLSISGPARLRSVFGIAMRFAFTFVIATWLAGCATTPDRIDSLAARLSASGGFWQNGFPPPALDLPESAPLGTVVSRVFELTDFDSQRVVDYRILKTRRIHIAAATPGDYTAVSIATNLGPKIVLLSYEGPKIGWWHRVYDANEP